MATWESSRWQPLTGERTVTVLLAVANSDDQERIDSCCHTVGLVHSTYESLWYFLAFFVPSDKDEGAIGATIA